MNRWRDLRRYFAEFGDVYRVFAPARGVYNYVINHPDDIKRVLLSNHRNYTKGEGMDRVKILLGNGIMTSEGDFWRRQRRMMQPSFHRRVIDQFSALLREVNDKFAARWADKAARAEPVNLSDDTSELTLEIVLRSIFGSDLARLEKQLGANPFEVVAKEQNRDLKFAFRFRSLTKLVAELINRRRREPEEHFDFLSMLMATRDRETDEAMSDKELIDEVLTLIVAGHETTAAALTWTWYLISQHPDTAARLQAEADAGSDRTAGARRRRIPAVHAPGAAGGAAAVSAGLAHHAPHARGGRARRLPHRPAHRCVHQPLHAAPASGLLERTGGVSGPNVSRAPMPRSGIDSPTFPSRSARGTASARTWPCSRCWCTSHAMSRRFRLTRAGERAH